MIRVLIFLAFIAAVAFGFVWIADRPGEIAITWQGRQIETSVLVGVIALVLVIAATIMLWSVIRTILRSPDLIGTFLSHRRGVRGYLAISRGLIAVGSGDIKAAQRASAEASRIAPGQPLALLLDAQCAQLAGDRTAAEHAFRKMTEHEDTKLLGLRGLFIEAQRRQDHAAARAYAEEAATASPSLGWAGQAVLEFRSTAGDWAGAQQALDRNSRFGLIDKTDYKRQRAVLITARALATEETDRDRARELALEALKLAPNLVPAAELAARLLRDAGEHRRAARIVEKAWEANPHPDLADTYAHLRSGDSARERLTRVQSLAGRTPGHPEGVLAVARAALEAQEFAAARTALKPLLKEPTQRAAGLMAEIERSESGDEGRAREWMARALHAARDPAWTADGYVSDRWMPVSPVSGRLDAFQWKVPLAEIGVTRDAVDVDALEAAAKARPVVIAPPAPDPLPDVEPAPAPEPPKPAPLKSEPAATAAAPASPPVPASAPAAPRAEAVIPLVHAPDDPGPEPTPELDPEPGPAAGSRGLRLF
ncbi:heme biosynthesis protein HemY [Rhodoplanes sp. Z2-YC6860]|uniref:heme biosynthesis protein HemY n=1 Tax=Rhodoplanes sp. Z2-YC6860 TaxID=674703 RepID=UPI00078BD28A|nr:heme biosynthesis HemY N-terminal domain-containing protein [Rhodoplanes sp. Z2-YC6860]AMN38634.1 HemY domain-containing protein [Rhodoplanes sp. Z2-YC6860]